MTPMISASLMRDRLHHDQRAERLADSFAESDRDGTVAERGHRLRRSRERRDREPGCSSCRSLRSRSRVRSRCRRERKAILRRWIRDLRSPSIVTMLSRAIALRAQPPRRGRGSPRLQSRGTSAPSLMYARSMKASPATHKSGSCGIPFQRASGKCQHDEARRALRCTSRLRAASSASLAARL